MKKVIQTLGTVLAYAYVLRVPLALWLLAVLLPLAAVPRGAPVGPLLRGLFDLSDPGEHATLIEHLIEALAFTLVTFAAVMVASAIAITARLILKDGAERFGIQKITVSPGIELTIRLLAALVPISIVVGSFAQSRHDVAWWAALAGTGLALVAFFGIVTPLSRRLWNARFGQHAGELIAIEAAPVWFGLGLFTRIVRETPEGFFEGGQLYRRHAFAWLQMLFSVGLYVLLFVVKLDLVSSYVRIPTRIPTLCLVLVLVMVVCWVLTALSFTLDRFRIPVIVVLVAYGTLVSVFPQNDHFFLTVRPDGAPREIGPDKILANRQGQPVIVVTAMGGGIHAGAWVARVLAGLQRDSRNCGTDFDQALRVISSVSGGSMGAMFIVDAYNNGTLTLPAAEQAVKASEASSLDDIAWALVYPDLVWTALPFLKAFDLTLDRGTVLEDSWKRTEGLKTATFDQWRKDALEGTRPAVIFNSTIVETGERMLFATTTIDGGNARGRIDFGTDRDARATDVQVATAARLSSTFPYVSPPARMKTDTVFDNHFHLVDGGYYDNYGTASLAEWVEQMLNLKSGRPSQVLVLQIRTFPAGDRPVANGDRGWLFEIAHPLVTLFHVRGAAQASTADITERLLKRADGDFVVSQTIDFPVLVAQDLDDLSPPLSWHLTASDRARLKKAWDNPDETLLRVRAKVQNFLSRHHESDTTPACIQ